MNLSETMEFNWPGLCWGSAVKYLEDFEFDLETDHLICSKSDDLVEETLDPKLHSCTSGFLDTLYSSYWNAGNHMAKHTASYLAHDHWHT